MSPKKSRKRNKTIAITNEVISDQLVPKFGIKIK